MNLARPAGVELIPAQVDGRPGQRLMVILRAAGCRHQLERGGCKNCGYFHLTTRGQPVPAELLLAQLEQALRQQQAALDQVLQLDLFCSGSFFCDQEIPPEARRGLLARASTLPALRRVLVETRPEFLSVGALAEAQAATRQQRPLQLEVAIGLETADDAIREHCIAKGFTRAEFEAAAALLAAAGVPLVAYVLQKPQGLSEAEALADVLATGRYLADLSRRLSLPIRVALEPVFVPEDTPLYAELQAGRYQPPSLWSVVQAALGLQRLLPVQVGLSDEGLPAANQPAGCSACTATLRSALAAFNREQDPAILTRLSCACWQHVSNEE